MDLDILEVIFKFGKILALTPTTTAKTKRTNGRKAYYISTFVLYISGTILSSFYKKIVYTIYTPVQLIVRLIMEADLLFSIYYHLLVVNLSKRDQWFNLISHLHRVTPQMKSKLLRYVPLLGPLTLYWVVVALLTHAWFNTMGWMYIKAYIMEHVQFFSLFFSITTANTVLRMLHARYSYQNLQLDTVTNQNKSKILAEVKKNLILLEESVDIFNDIFGWTYLLSGLFGVCRTLLYIDMTVKHNDAVTQSDTAHLVARIFVFGLFWVGFLQSIFLCDSVLTQFEEIRRKSLKLQVFWEDTSDFNRVVKDSCPQITCAGFVNIDRSIIFTILDSIVSILLFMVQFKPE